MASYSLSISFRSNEHPFSMIYEPYPVDRFDNDADAQHWAEAMAEGLGDSYNVTLLRDGKAVPQ